MNERLLAATRVICAIAAAATAGFVAWAASWEATARALLFIFGVMGWCTTPYVLLALVSRTPRRSRASAGLLLFTTLVVAAFAATVYVDTYFIHLDAQGALVLIFAPVWQLGGAIAGIVAASLLESRAVRRARREAAGQPPA